MSIYTCPTCHADTILDLRHEGRPVYHCQTCTWSGTIEHTLDLEAAELLTGSLDGEPVIGMVWYGADEELDAPEVTYISMEWMGRDFSTDGSSWVTLPSGGDLAGDTSLAEYGWIKEATTAGVIDRLIIHAQGIVDRPLAQFPLTRRERFVPTPKEEPVTHRPAPGAYWTIEEWERLGVGIVRTYLLEADRDGAEIHIEAALAYMNLAGGKAIWIAQIAIIKALGTDEWRRAVSTLPELPKAA